MSLVLAAPSPIPLIEAAVLHKDGLRACVAFERLLGWKCRACGSKLDVYGLEF